MKKTLSKVVVFVFALGASSWAQPVPPEVEVFVTPEKVKLGEGIQHRLVLRHPPEYRYELDAPPLAGPFTLVQSKRERKEEDGTSTTSFQLTWALFELGPHTLPTLTFQVFSPEGKATWQVPGKQLEGVATLEAHAENLRDIKAPESVLVRSFRVLYGALAALLALALVFVLLRFWRRRRRAASAEPVRVSLFDRTEQALQQLREEQLAEKGKVREFYFRLSEIVRAYLGERLQFDALECTTPELLEALRARPLPGLKLGDLEAFSRWADLARYARSDVSLADCQMSLDFAFRLLHDTRHPT